jgi:hypothetical protein
MQKIRKRAPFIDVPLLWIEQPWPDYFDQRYSVSLEHESGGLAVQITGAIPAFFHTLKSRKKKQGLYGSLQETTPGVGSGKRWNKARIQNNSIAG